MQPVLIAILPLFGVVVGAALQFIFGRNLETRKQLVLQRAQAYADYFKGFAGLAQKRNADDLSLVANAKTRICIYGSKPVVRALAAFEAAGSTASTPEGRIALMVLLQAMRLDVAQEPAGVQPDEMSRVLFGRAPV